jgi:tRNA-splicing ligase RtcB
MKKQDFINVGIKEEHIKVANSMMKLAAKAGRFHGITVRKLIKEIASTPQLFVNDEHFGELAKLILTKPEEPIKKAPIPYKIWGDLDSECKKQMDLACSIPNAVAAAIMPDNHLGYSVPIGGVIALDNAVWPMAVGVDISCAMRMSVIDIPVKELDKELKGSLRRGDKLSESLENGTRFGIGSTWNPKCEHNVMDRDWNCSPVTKSMKDRAWTQLGTSGSGNHFVEIGVLTINQADIGLESGQYLAILSHSGSRGAGANVCAHYNDIAASKCGKELAWLSLDSDAGQEYWAAMNLMANYATANHEVIHKNVANLLGAQVLTVISNSHNLAWREIHNNKELIVHRKGATPAGQGVLGVIPGSMADPCYVVRGKGNPDSLNSASHGAGRKFSRTEARRRFNWPEWKSILKQRGVRLLSAGLDEVPGSYKDIRVVMSQQMDLVDIVAEFMPRIVKMSADGRAED